jgi:hypothetical protein
VNRNRDTLKGIVVNESNPDIKIEHSEYYGPDYREPTVTWGPIGLNSTGVRTSVDGMVVVGRPRPGQANIFVRRGGGTNCSAPVVAGGCEVGPTSTTSRSRSLIEHGWCHERATFSSGVTLGQRLNGPMLPRLAPAHLTT